MASVILRLLVQDTSNTISFLLTFLIIFLVVKLFLSYYNSVFGGGGHMEPLPPGPLGNHLPIFGYIPFLGTKPAHETFTEMSKKYGKIFRVQLGSRMMVIISDHKLFREAFKREDMINRPHTPLNDGLMDGYGVSAAEGTLWKVQRHFARISLREMGMLRMSSSNKAQFEANAAKAVNILIQELDQKRAISDEPLDMEDILSFTVANVFCSTVISKTFDLYDPQLMTELRGLQDSFRIIESISLANFLPIFCLLPRFRRVLKTVLGRRKATHNFFRQVVAEHRTTLNFEKPRDLIDAFLIQMDKDQKLGVKTTFTEFQLLSLMSDLFSAGTETTKTTIRWLLLAMAKKPEIQKKVQEELDAVIGQDRCPVLSDRQFLPYMEATIQETLRMSSAVPMGNPHCPGRNITLNGYHIPKGSLVTGLLWKFHRDPTLWKNADDFDPSNFLHEDGSVYKPDYLMPFSTGRRICIGEDVARNEVFLISATLLQKYTFHPPKGVELPSLNDSREGFLRTPVSYKLKIESRDGNGAKSAKRFFSNLEHIS